MTQFHCTSAIDHIGWSVREVNILVCRNPLSQHEPWANWAQSHTRQFPTGTCPQWYWGGNGMNCCMGPGFTVRISAEEGPIISGIGWGSSPPGKRSTDGQYKRVGISVPLQLYLQQAKEIKAQSEKIKHFSTLPERNKPSWRKSRHSRVVSLRCLTLSLFYHG